MPKYRKKPVVIEAIQYTGENFQEIYEALPDIADIKSHFRDGSIIIPTLEGDMTAIPSDYIIRGVNGEFYPCKEDVFHKTYELVEEEYA
jgi:hypothetical protein